MNISYSKVELYNTCPYKYKLMYIDKWQPNKTYSALLFGSAIDAALNYILTRKKRGHEIYLLTASMIFQKYLEAWKGQNELVYFKNEAPNTEEFNEASDEEKQWLVFEHLSLVGRAILNTYVTQILPQLGTILSIQTKRFIKNQNKDKLILISDFRARLADGREVTFDNKTSSDIKKYYPQSSVAKSQQLAIYTEYETSKLAGYIALSKKLDDHKNPLPEKAYKIIVDEVPEKQTEEAFDRVDNTLRAIQREEFPKNEKSCFSFGRPCEMWAACKHNNYGGLIKK